jgi:hypothetical protein
MQAGPPSLAALLICPERISTDLTDSRADLTEQHVSVDSFIISFIR